MIFVDFGKSLGQLADRRFLRVMFLGVALSLALLAGAYAGLVGLMDWLTPEALSLPWIGEIGGIDNLIGWASLALMLALSVFLMVPVAAAFTGLFLDDVARAVEARHYPQLPPPPKLPLYATLRETVNFTGVLIALNVLALFLYAFVGPFSPLMFWALNGYLLGREYFQMAAERRIGPVAAKALRKRHWLGVWFAGMLMAAPLSLPLINLLIPVLGAATFTHCFHRLNRAAA